MKQLAKIILFSSYIVAGHVFAGEPTATDYQVWSAVVSDPGGTVYIWHETEPSSVYARGEDFGGGADPQAGQLAASASNQETAELRADCFKTETAVRILDRESLEKIVGRRPGPTWLLCPRAIEGAEEIFRLSLPSYSADGNTAYLLCCACSMYHGSVELVTIVKDAAGNWYARQFARKDFVHWKEANSFLNE